MSDDEGHDRLEAMFEMQDRFEELCVGVRFSALAKDRSTGVTDKWADRIAQFKEMKLALESEVQEALDEMGWKPWATSRHFNEELVQNELVDAWHFFICMCLLAGLTPTQLHEKYLKKILVNIDRQLRGYDGVSTKCPKCKRALDDPVTECVMQISEHQGFCVDIGRYNLI